MHIHFGVDRRCKFADVATQTFCRFLELEKSRVEM